MIRLDAKEALNNGQSGSAFDSEEWKAWAKRALKAFNRKARRALKKLEGGK
jgi:hypothetical protein